VREQDDRMVAWAPSIIEGSEVGRVALVISTARMRAGEALRRDILVLAGVASVAALLVGVFFVSFYMGPLMSLLERALNGLRELTQSLEERVKQRTLQLSKSKAKLEESYQKLQDTQRQLVEASRLTGMAEVATSVLHNVGNVLNSVNVSSHMVMDTLKRSKVDGLGKAVQLIRGAGPDLAAFWSSDKGKRLPDYLDALSNELGGERGRMLGELEALSRNIDHIKVIISMQQAHAKSAGGVTEILKLSSLIDDAISMNVVSYDKHHIDIEKHFDDVPEVQIDRHKVMQILMNLLSNARHAVKQHPDGEKHITVSLRRKDDDRVTITVSDSGVGIAPEIMTKIFVHGFTTKKDGHGFGLHSSALAARELGGTLTCASDGPGHGASFTLELPIKKPEPAGVADSDVAA
jgi:C4-dicarboxylate-specific signal transduction histidine kinase